MDLTGREILDKSCFWTNYTAKESWNESSLSMSMARSAVPLVTIIILAEHKFLLQREPYEESYKFFKLFLYCLHLRSILPTTCFFLQAIITHDVVNCEVCGFLDMFLDIFEIEMLTHICIDRYVVAKYLTKGWKLNIGHYKLYLGLCLFFSLLYSLPPVFGVGGFAKDFDCVNCVFDIILPEDSTRIIVLAIWFLRSVKPVIFMLIMLRWARKLEADFTEKFLAKSDPIYTRTIDTIVFICLLIWAPFAFIRGSVLLSQLTDGNIRLPPVNFISLGLLLNLTLPILITSAIYVMNSSDVARLLVGDNVLKRE